MNSEKDLWTKFVDFVIVFLGVSLVVVIFGTAIFSGIQRQSKLQEIHRTGYNDALMGLTPQMCPYSERSDEYQQWKMGYAEGVRSKMQKAEQ